MLAGQISDQEFACHRTMTSTQLMRSGRGNKVQEKELNIN
jgi:hypothetical protein